MNENFYKDPEQTLTGEIKKLKPWHRKTSGVAGNEDSLSDAEKNSFPEQAQCVETILHKGQLLTSRLEKIPVIQKRQPQGCGCRAYRDVFTAASE